MKKIAPLLAALFTVSSLRAQNVGVGTTTPVAKLHIKGSQDSSQLIIDANATQSNTHPLIRLRSASGSDLLAIHADDSSNIYMGIGAGRSGNQSNNRDDVFIGLHSGQQTTIGFSNVGLGTDALLNNKTGYQNVAIGPKSLTSNTSGTTNTAIGTLALEFNTTGGSNTAVGLGALVANSGDLASFNTGVGYLALYNTTNSQYNTAIGYGAGAIWDNGYNNVFLGASADVNGSDYYNDVAIGYSAFCTAPSQVTIGNSATTTYRAFANWTNISDGRFKRNIRQNVPGLEFITKLHPVTYNLNASDLETFLHPHAAGKSKAVPLNAGSEKANAAYTKALQEKEAETITGFVAQDVEAAARSIGYNFSGIKAPINDKDVYSLSYADFVVPLVKAVQEQQQLITDMQKQIDQLKEQNIRLLQMIKK
jgi:hypothetical protein